MPRQYKRETQKANSYTPDDLNAALEAIRSNGISIKRASVLYNIPKSTLAGHKTGRRWVKSQSLGRMTDIPIEQTIITESIKTMGKWGLDLSRQEI